MRYDSSVVRRQRPRGFRRVPPEVVVPAPQLLDVGDALPGVEDGEQPLLQRGEAGRGVEHGGALGVAGPGPGQRLLALHVLQPEVGVGRASARSRQAVEVMAVVEAGAGAARGAGGRGAGRRRGRLPRASGHGRPGTARPAHHSGGTGGGHRVLTFRAVGRRLGGVSFQRDYVLRAIEAFAQGAGGHRGPAPGRPDRDGAARDRPRRARAHRRRPRARSTPSASRPWRPRWTAGRSLARLATLLAERAEVERAGGDQAAATRWAERAETLRGRALGADGAARMAGALLPSRGGSPQGAPRAHLGAPRPAACDAHHGPRRGGGGMLRESFQKERP